MTEKKRKKKKPLARRILLGVTVTLGLCIFALLAALAALVYYNSPPESLPREADGITRGSDGNTLVEVRKGESAQSVGSRLEQASLIRSRYFWYALSRFRNEFIKSGTYSLSAPLSQMAIHEILVSGAQMLVRVTIPEGVTLKKTAVLLEEAGICPAGDFSRAAADSGIRARYNIPGGTMEGYLFPDTYLFPADFPADKVIDAMADNFFARLQRIEPAAAGMSAAEINDRVIIASIVEREYRVTPEAPLMAGVFYNRLDIGMALQSCATVEYVITEIQGRPHPDILYNRDIEIRDPYNTYTRPGLPPGPISAPGAAALDAAFHPESSDYLYFRLSDTEKGTHYFSRTLDDHIRAGLLYVKGR